MTEQVITASTQPANAIPIELLQDLKLKRRALIEENAPSIRAEFGDWLSVDDVEKVLQVRRDNAICAKCTGLPCTKTTIFDKNFTKVIRVFEDWQQLNVAARPCKFALQARQQKRIQQNFKRSRIPPKYIGKTFADYQVTRDNAKAVKWAKRIAENPNRSVYLYGLAGCGKTFLASIVAQELLNKGYSVIFGDVPSLLDDIKSTFNQNATVDDGFGYKKSAYDAIMAELEKVDLLVLDDIGAEKGTDWAIERLYAIINNRYNAQKAVLATSNYDAKGLIDYYKGDFRGMRITSRFEEMGEMVLIGGGDRRLLNKL